MHRAARRGELLTLPLDVLRCAFGFVMTAEMYSNNLTTARDAIVFNATKAMQQQRDIQMAQMQQQEDLAARRRTEDLEDEERRMKILAREMVAAMAEQVGQRP